MAAEEMGVRTRVTLQALRHPSGPERVTQAFRSQLTAATVAGTAEDLLFLTETAMVLPDPTTAVRFLKMTSMMRDKVMAIKDLAEALENSESPPNLPLQGGEVLNKVVAILDEAEREARLGFREDELAEAKLALDVMES